MPVYPLAKFLRRALRGRPRGRRHVRLLRRIGAMRSNWRHRRVQRLMRWRVARSSNSPKKLPADKVRHDRRRREAALSVICALLFLVGFIPTWDLAVRPISRASATGYTRCGPNRRSEASDSPWTARPAETCTAPSPTVRNRNGPETRSTVRVKFIYPTNSFSKLRRWDRPATFGLQLNC
jgi:hypothetical protein